jgi:hypothetical protein
MAPTSGEKEEPVNGTLAPPVWYRTRVQASKRSFTHIPVLKSRAATLGAVVMNDSREGRLIVQPSEITEVLNRPISQELLA